MPGYRTHWLRHLGWMLAIVVGCGGANLPHAESVFRIGNVGEPGSLDPQQISSTYENRVVGDMFLGLTTEAADGSMVPGAAESWTIDDDGRVYTFKLRDHKWSDGQTVTADDFVFAFRRVLEPAFAGIYASLLYPIQNAEKLNTGVLQGMEKLGVRALDKGTLQITLESPTPYFLELLTNFVAFPVPKHTVEQLGNDWAKPGVIVGNGAYVVTEWIPNTQVVSVKNAAFYDAANVSIDKVVYYADENQEALVKRFRAGEVDYAANFPSGQVDWLREHIPAAIRISPHLGVNYYVVNVRRPPFDDARVRRALSMAVNREAITDQVLRTGEIPAYSFVPPGTSNYGDPSYPDWKDTPNEQRLVAARGLLAQAGYGPGTPLKLTIRYNTSENYKRVAIAIQAMWKQIDVHAELENSEVKVHYNMLEEGNFDIGRAGMTADYDDAQNFLFLLQSTSGKQNMGQYRNPAYDRLMQQAAVTSDLQTRSGLLHQAEQMALDDAVVIPIMYYISKALVQPYVRGWVPNIKDLHRTRYISLER
jgi:oligopeptide transport system substrate-binding protein